MFAIEHETSIELVQRMKHSPWYLFFTNDQLAQLRQLQTGHRLHVTVQDSGAELHIMRLPNRIAIYPGSGALRPMATVLAVLGGIAYGNQFRSGAPLQRELVAI